MTLKKKSKIKEILQQAEKKHASKTAHVRRNTQRVLRSKQPKRSKRDVRSNRNMHVNEDLH
jgi:hypothetical protein